MKAASVANCPESDVSAETSRRLACERQANGKLTFTDLTGKLLVEPWQLTSPPNAEDPITWIDSQMPDVIIDSETCVALCRGERIDWGLAVGHLFD